MSRYCKALVLSLILAAACLPLAAQTYSFQAFSYPYFPNVATYALGINNRGAVVGYIYYKSGRFFDGQATRGFKRDANGVFEGPIDDPNVTAVYYAVATGINDSGDISGYYLSEFVHYNYSGFLVSSGVFTDYFLQPGPVTEIFGINNHGDFVGVDHRGFSAFASVNGVVTHFAYPGGGLTVPHGIAADGTIVGSFHKNHQTWGFLRGPAGQYKPFTIPGATDTVAYGINNAAHQIVGIYYTLGRAHGFVYDYITGVITTVDWPDPNTIYTVVTGINSQGVIVGWALVTDSQGHSLPALSFIGTPQ